MPGPPPKRSSQRRRANKPAVPITKAATTGEVYGPELVGTHSALGRRFYEALRRSGQAAFFQDSDWALAEIVTVAVDAFAKKPSAFMLTALNSTMTGLLVSEGDRRRLHLELDVAPDLGSERDAAITRLDSFRRQQA